MSYFALFTSLICFAFLFVLALLESSLKRLHKRDSRKIFKLLGHFFPYRSFLTFFFPKYDYEEVLFSTLVAKSAARFLCLILFSTFLYSAGFFQLSLPLLLLSLLGMVFSFYLVSDYIPRILGSRYPTRSLAIGAALSSPFLFACFPLIYMFITLSMQFWKTVQFDYLSEPLNEVKQEIFEILEEANLTSNLKPHDKKLIESVIYFQNRVAREVMVPRMDVFCLNASTSIQEAVGKLEDEGYSRVPVYKDTIDNIIGVLMYKDILTKYMEYQSKNNDISVLETPIETIVKKVMYTPESKKISNLLQDFKKKQVHMAIVVDEYGGTEGIVTIEDILEELVGEIADEYDDDEVLFVPIGKESWIVDARMSIIDADEQLGLDLPQGSDYDTIGGFIFHKAGTIPSRGFTINLDHAELEILKSNDRRVEKVKIRKKTENGAS